MKLSHLAIISLLSFALVLPAFAAKEKKEKKDFTLEGEVGVVALGGNIRTTTVSMKEEAGFHWENNSLSQRGRYLYGSAYDSMIMRNWEILIKYERGLSKRTGVFFENIWEGDAFAGYDYRLGLGPGFRYYFIKKKGKYLFSELGYRFLYEQGTKDADIPVTRSHYSRLYVGIKTDLTKDILAQMWVEYLYDFGDSNNYQFNSEPSLRILLTNNFSLRLSLLGRYDNLPAKTNRKKFDFTYTTAVVVGL